MWRMGNLQNHILSYEGLSLCGLCNIPPAAEPWLANIPMSDERPHMSHCSQRAPAAKLRLVNIPMSVECEHIIDRAPAGLHGEKQFPTPTLYINREVDKDRRAWIETELRDAGINGERICGVEGVAVPPTFVEYFFEGDKLHSMLKPGEVGCYASHLKALSVVVERGLACALILEDDALLSRDFTQTIESILANVPEDWDMVHLCRDPEYAVKPVTRLKHSRMLVRYSRVPATTTGYLISRAGAEKFLRPLKRYWPVDTDFRQPWRFGLEIYGVVPSIVSVAGFTSSIHALGNHSRGRRGIPMPSRDCWTGNPLHTPQGLYFNLKTLGPLWWARCWLHNAHQRAMRILRPQHVSANEREPLGATASANLTLRSGKSDTGGQ
jgi:glycosyl transferase family 25